MSLRYEDVHFGDELPERRPDVGLATVRRFAKAAHMTFGRFTDHDEARSQGLPAAIVPGIMSQGILVAMIHSWAPEARIHHVDTIFRAPVFVDSQPVCRGVVTDRDDETRRVEIDLTLVNEAGETRVLGTAKVELP